MRRCPSIAVLLSACAVTALAGCSGSSSAPSRQPAVSDFAVGTCRTVAPDVLQLGTDAQRLGNGGDVDKNVLSSLEKAQLSVRQVTQAAEPAYKSALQDLVVTVGLVRLEAKVGSYKPATGDELKKSYAAVVAACTKAPAATATP